MLEKLQNRYLIKKLWYNYHFCNSNVIALLQKRNFIPVVDYVVIDYSPTLAELQQQTRRAAPVSNWQRLKGGNVWGWIRSGVRLHIQFHWVNLLISPGASPKSNQWSKVGKEKLRFPSSHSSSLFPQQLTAIKRDPCRRCWEENAHICRVSWLTLSPAARAGVQVVWIEPVGSVHLGQQLSDVHHLPTATNTVWVSGWERLSVWKVLQDPLLCVSFRLWNLLDFFFFF